MAISAPLTQWTCDSCGRVVTDAADGYVVWHSRYGKVDDLRIVHRATCNEHQHVSGAELKRFLGPEGLSYVISLICAGPVRAAAGHCSTHAPADLEAFGDFVRRVQVPYYEEARSKFGMPAIRQKFAQASQFVPYRVDSLKSIAEEGET